MSALTATPHRAAGPSALSTLRGRSTRNPSEDRATRTGVAAATGRALLAQGSGSRQPSANKSAITGSEEASSGSSSVPTSRGRSQPPKDSLEDLLNGGLQIASKSHAAVPPRIAKVRSQEQGLDFDEEARKLWARLNLDPSLVNHGPYNALDPLWRHPQTGGVFYVGNQTAAANLALLQQHKITHVVNCTDNMPNYHEKIGSRVRYFRFNITGHYRQVRSDSDAVQFVKPMLNFVTAALEEGRNVMAHCLAGAHRAGTTGCICLMHFAELPKNDAVAAAKRCRPIIDPIGDFPELLAKLERGWKVSKSN